MKKRQAEASPTAWRRCEKSEAWTPYGDSGTISVTAGACVERVAPAVSSNISSSYVVGRNCKKDPFTSQPTRSTRSTTCNWWNRISGNNLSSLGRQEIALSRPGEHKSLHGISDHPQPNLGISPIRKCAHPCPWLAGSVPVSAPDTASIPVAVPVKGIIGIIE